MRMLTQKEFQKKCAITDKEIEKIKTICNMFNAKKVAVNDGHFGTNLAKRFTAAKIKH